MLKFKNCTIGDSVEQKFFHCGVYYFTIHISLARLIRILTLMNSVDFDYLSIIF